MKPRFARMGVDRNQDDIVNALENIGCSVVDLSGTPKRARTKGLPDLLVGWRGKNYLMEVKALKETNKRGRLRESQYEFFAKWKGQCCVIRSLEDALRELGLTLQQQPPQ